MLGISSKKDKILIQGEEKSKQGKQQSQNPQDWR